MKTKLRGILLAVSALLFVAMLILSHLSSKAGYRDLYMITPQRVGIRGSDINKLETFCEDKFLITYEIRQQAMVQAANSKHSVVLVGTNSAYLSVIGYRLLDGSFFTKAAWDSKSRHAALNKTAAYAIFGNANIAGNTMRINGEMWIVTGVIDDGDEDDSVIYVPSSITDGQAQSLMALSGPKGSVINGEYIISELKNIGVRDTDYDFLSLSRSSSIFTERFSVAWKAALILALILLGKKGAIWIIEQLPAFKNGWSKAYFREFLAEQRIALGKSGIIAAFLLAGFVIALYLLLQILAVCLTWQELSVITPDLTGSFINKTEWIRDYQYIGTGVFTAFILSLSATFVMIWTNIKKQPKAPAAQDL